MKNISITLITLLLFSCSDNKNAIYEEDSVMLNMDNIELDDNTDEETISTKKIIETNIYISAKNLEKAKIQLDQIINESKAEVSEENISDNEIKTVLYVPRRSYETAINAFNENTFDVINGKSTTTTNITKKYYELKNQLNSDDILLAKYQELLKKSTAIEDVLTIYERIENLEREQRNRNDQMAYYNKMQDYNLVTVTIRKISDEELQDQSFIKQSAKAIFNGVYLVKNFFLGVLSLWPFILIICLIIFGVKKYRNKKNKS